MTPTRGASAPSHETSRIGLEESWAADRMPFAKVRRRNMSVSEATVAGTAIVESDTGGVAVPVNAAAGLRTRNAVIPEAMRLRIKSIRSRARLAWPMPP